MKYEIYFTDSANEELQGMPRDRFDQLSVRLERLRNGDWGNGTRVKKLRSINRARTIYEARADRARRMLFTIVKNRETNRKAALLIFHFEVEHDDVIRTASVLLQEEYTPERYEEEKPKSCSLDELVSETQPVWTEEQDLFYCYLNQLKSYELDEDSVIRLMQSKEMAGNEYVRFKLSLSPEQRSYAEAPLPILLGGTAGSGKTTIMIHKLLETDAAQKKLYVTYTKDLCDEAGKMFRELVAGLDDEELYKRNTYFKTFDQLVQERRYDKSQDVVKRERFLHTYGKYARSNRIMNEFPALMMWEEIRGIIKGGRAFDGYILPEPQYMKLSRDQAPNFFDKRKAAYEHFRNYQKQLEDEFKVDEQDLLYQSIQSNHETYDYVFCDEVQDLTLLHIRLLHTMVNENAARLFLTGDDQQILHHSGFRWANINDLFTQCFKHRPPELLHLSFNYRSVGSIIDLAGVINGMERDLTDRKIKAKPSISFIQGDKPRYYSGMAEQEMGHFVHSFGPHQAIIVRTEEERNELRHYFRTTYGLSPLIFSIVQVKGLEFERVMIWDFFRQDSEEHEFWNTTTRQMGLGQTYRITSDLRIQRKLSSELNMLYVAVTRASHVVYIYDRMPSGFWNLPAFGSYLDNNVALEHESAVGAAASDEKERATDWVNEGVRLMKRKLYTQALDCFERASGDQQVERYVSECEAWIAYENGDYEAARHRFERAGLNREVVRCLDALEDFQAVQKFAMTIARRNKEEASYWNQTMNEYKVRQFDSEGHWRGAAIVLNNILHRHYDAGVRFLKINDRDFARDAFKRELRNCDPSDVKRVEMLQQRLKELSGGYGSKR
ncbi:UvrD-helicase domain-containing protein [Paenibacillus kobensis]|uniref:UvrD-helicase domain-containing protein n=1 Tax=Paenibacillus kobensis TaxID=59841 RepID=UPI000FD85477|nr:UvrD-helicase domain-containing protein [Paenibacillus kobensis]